MSTPMHPTSILSLHETDKKVDQTSYKDMIDSLLYLTSYQTHTKVLLILVFCGIRNLIRTSWKESSFTPLYI
ncbi:hypothetical protein CR513_48437, partial [Mucuna pruriens]